jgi:probable rRNA maturation factor
LQKPCEEISVYFVTELEIAALHEQFFQDPTPTDCITFPPGEIVVCPGVAIAYAKKRKGDPLEETVLYVVHGILHLLGFDDMEPSARKTMRKMEKKCMAYLKTQGFFQ